MDCYLASFGLQDGVHDADFVKDLEAYMTRLKATA